MSTLVAGGLGCSRFTVQTGGRVEGWPRISRVVVATKGHDFRRLGGRVHKVLLDRSVVHIRSMGNRECVNTTLSGNGAVRVRKAPNGSVNTCLGNNGVRICKGNRRTINGAVNNNLIAVRNRINSALNCTVHSNSVFIRGHTNSETKVRVGRFRRLLPIIIVNNITNTFLNRCVTNKVLVILKLSGSRGLPVIKPRYTANVRNNEVFVHNRIPRRGVSRRVATMGRLSDHSASRLRERIHTCYRGFNGDFSRVVSIPFAGLIPAASHPCTGLCAPG